MGIKIGAADAIALGAEATPAASGRTSPTVSRDTGPVTTPRPPARLRWWRLLLAAVAAVLGVLLSARTASAATLPTAETRVVAITIITPTVVGFDEGVWTSVAAKTGDEFVNLASQARTTQILQGDATGGGHFWPGGAGKTSIPQSWSGRRVMHEISDVATDPASVFTPGRGGSTVVTGARDGVDIRDILRGGDIITGHPTNLPRNP